MTVYCLMGTTTKALELLGIFSPSRPEIGLSNFARLAGRDKATTHRMLTELTKTGFVEQARHSKLYRLGPAVLRLANIREQTFPVKKAAARHLENLVEAVQETAHITMLQGDTLTPVHNHHSQHHTTRVHIDPAEVLPLHATASGNAMLAFGPAGLLDKILTKPLAAKTPDTTINPDVLCQKVAGARSTGFGTSAGEFEVGVSSIAAPLFGENDLCAGAVAVACPSGRMTPELDAKIRSHLAITANAITQAWGGRVPDQLADLWKS